MRMSVQAAEDPHPARDRSFGDLTPQSYYRFSRTATWHPPVNVYEEADRICVCVELAGLNREQIDVEVAGNRILIKGERPVPTPAGGRAPGNILRMEIDSGPFERAVEMPGRADMATTEARFDEGFLWITVNKRP